MKPSQLLAKFQYRLDKGKVVSEGFLRRKSWQRRHESFKWLRDKIDDDVKSDVKPAVEAPTESKASDVTETQTKQAPTEKEASSKVEKYVLMNCKIV